VCNNDRGKYQCYATDANVKALKNHWKAWGSSETRKQNPEQCLMANTNKKVTYEDTAAMSYGKHVANLRDTNGLLENPTKCTASHTAEMKLAMNADNRVEEVWIDGFEFKKSWKAGGFLKTDPRWNHFNDGRANMGHQTIKLSEAQLKIALQSDTYKLKCQTDTCTHVIAVKVRENGGEWGGFISDAVINAKQFASGKDNVWRATYETHTNSSWTRLDYDDSHWRNALRCPDFNSAWNTGGNNNFLTKIQGAKWVAPNGNCQSNLGSLTAPNYWYFRMKFNSPSEAYCKCQSTCSSYALNYARNHGEECTTFTDTRCGVTSKVCRKTRDSDCASACSTCPGFWQRWWPDIFEKYYGGSAPPSDWGGEGCFRWGVVWPCRNCRRVEKPDDPIPEVNSIPVKPDPTSPRVDCPNVDNTPTCVTGWKPCGGGVPKCYDATKSTLTREDFESMCKPFPVEARGECSEHQTITLPPDLKPKLSHDDDDDDDDDGDGEGRRRDDNGGKKEEDDESGNGNGTPGKNIDGAKKEDDDGNRNVTVVPIPRQPLPPKFCPTCANARFQCCEAQCEHWDCLWWCRCYDERVDYPCNDDGDECDCGAFGESLWDVTYDELLASDYMKFQFAGPGSDELMKRAVDAEATQCE
jgi:hypothetical protein